MKTSMKTEKRLVKRCMVLALTLTAMLIMLVPPAIASYNHDGELSAKGEMLTGITDMLEDSGKPVQSRIYKLIEEQEKESEKSILIAPIRDTPGDSGIGIISLFAVNARAATNMLPLAETKISMLLSIGIVGLIAVKRQIKK